MAYDAGQAALNNDQQPRQTLRIKACREYRRMGREFLERGIRNNPDRYVLYNRLGALLMNKIGDHEAAYEAYAKAAEFPDCMGYEKRFAAYELSKCPGREAQAYDLLLKLYRLGPLEHTPTLLLRIHAMEEALKIPPEQRVYNPRETPS
jgi:tetratricopeptide (TPR) repeat protein